MHKFSSYVLHVFNLFGLSYHYEIFLACLNIFDEFRGAKIVFQCIWNTLSNKISSIFYKLCCFSCH